MAGCHRYLVYIIDSVSVETHQLVGSNLYVIVSGNYAASARDLIDVAFITTYEIV